MAIIAVNTKSLNDTESGCPMPEGLWELLAEIY